MGSHSIAEYVELANDQFNALTSAKSGDWNVARESVLQDIKFKAQHIALIDDYHTYLFRIDPQIDGVDDKPNATTGKAMYFVSRQFHEMQKNSASMA